MAKTAVNQANINASEMRSIPIAMPPSDVQLKFSSTIAQLNSQREQELRALTELNELFASLQSRAFSGQL